MLPLTVTMDIFVDLPASQKGSHMSRNLELVSKIIDETLQSPVSNLESFCAETVELLLKKHEYATFSEIKAEADYFLDVVYPSGQKGMEPVTYSWTAQYPKEWSLINSSRRHEQRATGN